MPPWQALIPWQYVLKLRLRLMWIIPLVLGVWTDTSNLCASTLSSEWVVHLVSMLICSSWEINLTIQSPTCLFASSCPCNLYLPSSWIVYYARDWLWLFAPCLLLLSSTCYGTSFSLKTRPAFSRVNLHVPQSHWVCCLTLNWIAVASRCDSVVGCNWDISSVSFTSLKFC